MRVIIDESASFGVLGQTGRGLTEHFDIPVSWNCLRLRLMWFVSNETKNS